MFSLLISSIAAAATYLAPPASKIGPAAVLVFIQGAQIPSGSYVDTVRAIQDAANFPIHALLPEFLLDLALPIQSYMHSGIQNALKLAPSDLPVYIAGHSLGAAAAMEEASAYPSLYKACIIYGASVNRKYEYNFPIPILAVNAELDGLQRVSRVGEAFYNYFDRKRLDIDATTVAKNPIVVVEGMSHIQYADGKRVPVTVSYLDLKPDISTDQAHQQVAAASSYFLCLQQQTCDDASPLVTLVQNTRRFLDPMLKAFAMEASPNLYTACNSDKPSPHCPYYPAWPLQPNRTMSGDSDCVCGVPFTNTAAHIMAGLDESKYPLINVDAIHDVSDTKPYHHAHIWSNCTVGSLPCLMNSTTVSQVMYEEDSSDSGFPSATAYEIRVKMKARQIYKLFSSDPNVPLDSIDQGNICADINQASYNWALETATEKANNRFSQYGQPMVMQPDSAPILPIGPLFINSKLGFKDAQVDGKWQLQVTSVGFKTPEDSFVTHLYPDSNGYHYCKVLSPARVMEWIYSDGLRKNKEQDFINKMKLYTSYLLAAVVLSMPNPALNSFVLKDSIKVPTGWVEQHNFVNLDQTVDFGFGLKQTNMDQLVAKLFEVSDPSHSNYGKHLTKEQVDALTAPSQETIKAVTDWLVENGVDASKISLNSAKDWLHVKLPLSKAQQLLKANYKSFTHPESGKTVVRTTEFSLPEKVHQHIDLVKPTTLFGARPKKIAQSQASGLKSLAGSADCSNGVTPSCLKSLYNIGTYAPTNKNNQVAVTSYEGQYASTADLQQFLGKYNPTAKKATFKFVSVNGGKNVDSPGSSGVEAALDIETTVGLTYPTQNIFYSTGDGDTSIQYFHQPDDWALALLAKSNSQLPQVVSTSYGDDEPNYPSDFAVRACNDFAKLGARGVSLIFASGDGGVNGGHGQSQCQGADGSTQFVPVFPATCPFITSVGATTDIPETAAQLSSGGFSNYFSRPSYQDSAVNSYLNFLGSTYSGYYNSSGRAFPDVSAQGQNYQIVSNRQVEGVDGTSCSSPAFAAIVSLINDNLLNKGKSALGFLNPWLYSKGYKGLNDVTSGNNPGCDTDGFSATAGYDPVTGLGTPDFKKLLALV
ncbi:hypothetical protein HDV01_002590 [Terramyces sp. JEL0728]|nr:hypothetical protein HDV01_002590 [Terramyces sp. JEL0728]